MATTKRNALGRGLGALLQDAETIQRNSSKAFPSAAKHTSAGVELPLEEIEPNPYQPRTTFDEETIAELADSIRSIGIVQPITVRKAASGKYQIISGERRYRAARLAGLKTVPAYIREADDSGMLEMAIVENIQRENLDAVETALSFRRLMEECGFTQEQLADRVGKKRATVANYLRLLSLPVEIQKALKVDRISVGHAKALLSLPDEESQMEMCTRCVAGDWSVRKLEKMVRDRLLQADKDTPQPPKELPDEYYRVLELVGKYFRNDISLKRGVDGSGRITIRFKSDEEIARFLRALENNII
ncbi:MAG: ParB/RepB/Spo0J family partition protein [Bacteroidales bacterium]|nr:ParB/RepB/Spo0J family partition protein [Bacteroidales bacterium]MBO7478860.1 ParB/RepB/Spo0J family partition protein [Bacteroidales bacterium]MBO7488052.1 ParB/RepB/Spo0J family partition protein [Bacteroidales bacterium]